MLVDSRRANIQAVQIPIFHRWASCSMRSDSLELRRGRGVFRSTPKRLYAHIRHHEALSRVESLEICGYVSCAPGLHLTSILWLHSTHRHVLSDFLSRGLCYDLSCSVWAIVVNCVVGPGTSHATHLFGIPSSDLVVVSKHSSKCRSANTTYPTKGCVSVRQLHEQNAVHRDEQDASPLRQLHHLVPVGPGICQLCASPVTTLEFELVLL